MYDWQMVTEISSSLVSWRGTIVVDNTAAGGAALLREGDDHQGDRGVEDQVGDGHPVLQACPVADEEDVEVLDAAAESDENPEDEIMQLQQQLEKAKVDSNENEFNKKSIKNYVEELQIKNGVISSLETELQISKENLNSLQSKFDDTQNADKILEEKQLLERQLERVTLEMASIQNVVTEMTKSFKQQIMLKDQEVKKYQEQNVSLSNVNMELQRKCRELEDIGRAHKEKLDDMEKRVAVTGADMKMDNGDNDDLEHGSLDDLSNLVQAELDRSTELDNTLLSQVVSGLSLDNSGVAAASSSGVTEIQRLIKKIQGDGVKVLSLSERLFLMQHANVAKNITQLSSASDSDTGGGSKEKELSRKLEILECQLRQEKFLAEDLRKSLSNEKRVVLDSLGKVSQERRSRSELETRLSYLEQELGAAREKLAAAEQQLRSRDQQLHFNSDSENEEFLNTIETQRLQLLALEDSLRQEKDNFAQLQRVLQVERGRGRREAEL